MKKAGRTVRVTFRVPEKLARWAQEKAKGEGRTVTDILVEALSLYRELGAGPGADLAEVKLYAKAAAVIAAQIACGRKADLDPDRLLEAVISRLKEGGGGADT
ncbi:hypothetical protein G7K71_02880 [Desulfofundulus sp. TPOSR]|uniref:hypothetical protein n=1 Tax=Desulfofundulus sp. TPOSR TaxID=2714340 RepID=UPI00140B5894|nr:hypothetical protein [Desulfofundulus sp. TPOSR]NHM25971.1 hypothetical protein [Desulfofundulus sp. TPOSR]